MTTSLITGANKGLAFETARQLAAAGHQVWIGARDHARGRQSVTSSDTAVQGGRLPPGAIGVEVLDDTGERQRWGPEATSA
jgi:NAD(P)-dependent dehydrogenase (short-subunit alcohol dehydrogenase family)